MKKGGTVYIITNQRHTVFYVGVTSDLLARISQHKRKHYPKSFSAKYNLDKLLYFENHPTIMEAITREKVVKKYSRKKKKALINSMNPDWSDLYNELVN